MIVMYNIIPVAPLLEMYIKPAGQNMINITSDRKVESHVMGYGSRVTLGGSANLIEIDDVFVWDDVLDEDAINILLKRSE